MKKLALICGLLSAGALGLQAASCSATMTLTQLSALTPTGGCDFNGYNFNNFALGNYIDFMYGGSAQYNFTASGSTSNTSNYLANFAVLNGTGVSVTFTGAVAQPDGPAWTLTADNSNFGFEIKYNISSGTNDVNALKILSDTLGGVVYSGAPGADASAAFNKAALIGGVNYGISNKVTAETVGSQTKFRDLPSNSSGVISITDNLLLQISNSPNTSITATTLGNSFSQIPEPMTLTLMGVGLVGLALVRRRSRG